MDQMKQVSWPGWETVGLIGRGSFGAVYEIRRTVFKDTERAALKVISIPQNSSDIAEMYSEGYDDESITSAFQGHLESIVAEYSLMRKMSGSTNIVNCDDVRYIQHDDGIGWDIFIKMELLTPLTGALMGQFSEEGVLKVAADICAALELCRKHDVIHRDIKPQNIYVSPNGDYKLGDFGIAKTVEKTMGGTKIGTYKYMAPEVYNNRPYGHSADIYSLGMVLYWLLNERRLPFLPLPPEKLTATADEAARLRRFAGEPLPRPKNGSEELKRIVLKACAYDPAERYQTATQMAADIAAIRDAREAAAREAAAKEAAEREAAAREAAAREAAAREAAAREAAEREAAARAAQSRQAPRPPQNPRPAGNQQPPRVQPTRQQPPRRRRSRVGKVFMWIGIGLGIFYLLYIMIVLFGALFAVMMESGMPA